MSSGGRRRVIDCLTIALARRMSGAAAIIRHGFFKTGGEASSLPVLGFREDILPDNWDAYRIQHCNAVSR